VTSDFPPIPPGYALVRIEDLTTLAMAQEDTADTVKEAETASWVALSAAVALITAQTSRVPADFAMLTADVSPAALVQVLTLLAATLFSLYVPAAELTRLLQGLGLDAAANTPTSGTATS
jgi:hypothetical protein